jgi:excisionase family DNA binding protein
MNEQNTEKLLTAQTVGEMLSLSKRQIFRMKSAGLICPSVRVGRGAIRFRRSDIEKWIAMGCPDRNEFEARREAR